MLLDSKILAQKRYLLLVNYIRIKFSLLKLVVEVKNMGSTGFFDNFTSTIWHTTTLGLLEIDLYMRAVFQCAPRAVKRAVMLWPPQRRGGLDTIGASR